MLAHYGWTPGLLQGPHGLAVYTSDTAQLGRSQRLVGHSLTPDESLEVSSGPQVAESATEHSVGVVPWGIRSHPVGGTPHVLVSDISSSGCRLMALVRCTCVLRLETAEGRLKLQVLVADPECEYVVHRVVADPVRLPAP
jgi:hypothetical protein